MLPRVGSRMGVGGESFSGHQCDPNSRGWSVWKHLSALTPPHVTCFVRLKRHLRMTCLFSQMYRRCPASSPRRLPAIIPVFGQMTMTSFGRPTSGIISGNVFLKNQFSQGRHSLSCQLFRRITNFLTNLQEHIFKISYQRGLM